MSWVRVYVHLVFCTKNREPLLLSSDLRKNMFQHIKTNTAEKDIWLDCVSGWQEHAHCLFSLGKEQTISNVAKLIKGESSFWINHNNLIENKFVWQDDYWAVGVSESHVQAVRRYIHNQEKHHTKQTFAQEVNGFMEKYGWSFIKEQ
jgi:REP element-mobilizing transposase RayT